MSAPTPAQATPPPDQPRPRRRVQRVLAAITRFVLHTMWGLFVRLPVAVMTVVLLAYFALNSPTLVARVVGEVSAGLRGELRVTALRFGPNPNHIQLIRPAVHAPDGTPVISAEWLDVQVDWTPLVRMALEQSAGPLAVRLPRAAIRGLELHIDEDEDGALRLTSAFEPATPQPESEPTTLRLRLDALSLRESAYIMDIGDVGLKAHGIDIDGRVALDLGPSPQSDDSGPRLFWSTTTFSARQLALKLDSLQKAGIPPFPVGAVAISEASGDLSRIQGAGISVDLPATRLRDMALQIDLGETVRVQGTGLDLTTSTASPFLGALLGPSFQARGKLKGDFEVTPEGAFVAQAKVHAGGRFAGFELPRVRGDVSFQTGHSETVQVAIEARALHVEGYGGSVDTPLLGYQMRAEDGAHMVKSNLRLRGFNAGGVLRESDIAMEGPVPTLLAGALDGRLDVDTTVALLGDDGDDDTVDVAVEFSSYADLTLTRTADAEPLGAALPALHLRGGTELSMGRDRGPQVSFDRVELRSAPPERAPDAAVHELSIDGQLDTASMQAKLAIGVEIPELGELLGPLGIAGMSGSISLRDGALDGDVFDPAFTARFDARRLVAGGLPVGTVRAGLRLKDGSLQIRGLQVDGRLGRVRGRGELQLYDERLTALHPRLPLTMRDVALDGLVLPNVLRALHVPSAEQLRGVATARIGALRVELADPVRTVSLHADVHIDEPGFGDDVMREATTSVAMRRGVVTLDGINVELPGGSRVLGDARYDLNRSAYEANIDVPSVSFDLFRELAEANLPLHGEVALQGHVAGDRRDVAFEARVALADFRFDTITLGDAVIDLTKKRGEDATLTSPSFFEHLTLLEGSHVAFARGAPSRVEARFAARDLDPFATLGLPPIEGIAVRSRGNAKLVLDFRPGHDVFGMDVHVPAEGAVVDLGFGFEPLRNATALDVNIDPAGLRFDRVEIVMGAETNDALGPSTREAFRLGLCGGLDFGVGAEPDIDDPGETVMRLYTSGGLDIPRVGPLAESMATLDVGFDIIPDPSAGKDAGATCLGDDIDERGWLRIAGPLDRLGVQGRLRTRDSVFAPRGFGRDIGIDAGAELHIRDLGDGRMQLQIPDAHPFNGRLEDGRFGIRGQTSIVDMAPETVDMKLDGVDVSYVVPREYTVVVSPTLAFTGRHLRDATRRKMLLEGDVMVTEGAYYRSFDRIAKVASGLADRELGRYSKPVTEIFPWINKIGMDLDVRGSAFEVASRFPVGRADLELDLGVHVFGTLGDLRVKDRVRIVQGSQLTYSVVKREFEVVRGSIDFNGDPSKMYLDLEARATINASTSQAAGSTLAAGIGQDLTSSPTGQDNQIIVTVKLYGPIDMDPLDKSQGIDTSGIVLELSSVPPYSEQDLQSLILTGALLTGDDGGFAPPSINILTDDLADAVSQLFLSAFVDNVSLGVTTRGGVQAVVDKTVGRVKMYTQVTTGGSGQGTDNNASSYRAGFVFQISDRMSMEGLLRVGPNPNANDTQQQSTLEAKLRYRVPLDG